MILTIILIDLITLFIVSFFVCTRKYICMDVRVTKCVRWQDIFTYDLNLSNLIEAGDCVFDVKKVFYIIWCETIYTLRGSPRSESDKIMRRRIHACHITYEGRGKFST